MDSGETTMPKLLISGGMDNEGRPGCRFRRMITTKGHPRRSNHPMSQFPPTYTPASDGEELEHLKELLAEAEEVCLALVLKKHLEAQRIERRVELLSKELQGIAKRLARPSER